MTDQKRPPGEESWTDAQWRAINEGGNHILVTAGAGAGKTRVLIKRLLEMICDQESPLEVDRLLVVTFTNAAAAEMKKRLAGALDEKIRQNPRANHLRRQLLLLNKAHISTVHSFCLEVIREYYHLIDLDPSFRMLDEGEALLLQQDLLEDLLEDYYASQELDSPFYRLVEGRSGVRGDRPLQDLILRLYRFAWSHPHPQAWLEEQARAFAPCAHHNAAGATLAPWLTIIREDCRRELAKLKGLMQLALETANRPGGPEPYRDSLAEELAMIEKAMEATGASWETLSLAVQEISFGRLKPCRKDDALDPALREQTTALRDRCKKELANLKEQYFSRTLQDHETDLQRLAPLLQILVELVQEFQKRYLALKRERGVADFNDLEHHALQILRHPDSVPGRPLPSEAALAYRENFVCVLVDEYQDINQLQETIISLVSREEPGNIFMVGDVKQSIYRFRLAEPELFLHKLHAYKSGALPGEAIPLAHNFRSRREVIEGVNYLFQQLMDEEVGEVAYDHDARLQWGAVYPPLPGEDGEADEENPYAMELQLISLTAADGEGNGKGGEGAEKTDSGETGPEEAEETEEAAEAEEEWEMAALEGKLIARRIMEMRGEGEGRPLLIYDKKTGGYKPPAYRDMVILLRSYQNNAPVILEELQHRGIPAYAELATGYFAATEVEVMLSLLKIIDNPYQDIPMAAVLRSPLVGLNSEDLALIRLAAPNAPYYDALKAFDNAPASNNHTVYLREKTGRFMEDLFRWQELAQQDSLCALIRQLYSDSGYYDILGGMTGGRQRQANLRALYDRARQYEATTLRGLSRFLRFVERLRERGGDLGAARALGEQEDVVRIITVHKSKGLEFPVVFVAGLSRRFNLQELGRDFLLHKELGFGPKIIDTELRLTYPTLPWHALKKRLRLELLAEEMRILYVALTRAEQKLVLVAGSKDLGAGVRQWEEQTRRKQLLLPAYERAAARSFMDWLGPSLLRHPQAEPLRRLARDPEHIHTFAAPVSCWRINIINGASLCAAETAYEEAAAAGLSAKLAGLERLEPVEVSPTWEAEVARRLEWSYPHGDAAQNFAKLSVSALQRLQRAGLQDEDGDKPAWRDPSISTGLRPRFLAAGEPGVAEEGTAYHILFQNLDLGRPVHAEAVAEQLEEMARKEQLTPREQELVEADLVTSFFQTTLGRRLLQSSRIWRELPFTMNLPASELYPRWQGEEEQVFIQGVIDCLFQEDDGLVLIDYKLGSAKGKAGKSTFEQYRTQLQYYARAASRIRRELVKEAYIYLIKQKELLQVELD